MSTPWLIHGHRHGIPLVALATTLGVLGVSLTATSAALAESATGFNGMVTVSAPTPVVAGVPSTYTLTFTNTTSSPLTNVVADGSLPSGFTLQRIGGCARLGGNQSQSILCSLPNLEPGRPTPPHSRYSLRSSEPRNSNLARPVARRYRGIQGPCRASGTSSRCP